jgi:hypothetical protein
MTCIKISGFHASKHFNIKIVNDRDALLFFSNHSRDPVEADPCLVLTVQRHPYSKYPLQNQ